MNINDITTSISQEIWAYQYTHGCEPVKIFMSMPLVRDLMNRRYNPIYAPYSYDPNKWIGYFEGIEVQPYHSEEYEFYLAERKGVFRIYE